MAGLIITGWSGFIGSHFLRLCEEDIYLFCVSRGNSDYPIRKDLVDYVTRRKNISFLKADILSYDGIKNIVSVKAPILVHFAWVTEHGKYWESLENIKWLYYSFELVRSFIEAGGKKVLVAGTCAEYDWSMKIMKENSTPEKPFSLYGLSKLMLLRILEHLCKRSGVKLIWGRIFFAFGPGEDRRKLIPSSIISLMKWKRTECLKSDVVRDFVYVEDVADAFLKLLKSDSEGIINIGTGVGRKIVEVVRKIASLLGGEVTVKNEYETYPYVVADISKLKLVKKEFWDFDKALKSTIDWWKGAGI